jgi:hypothetical protein
MRKWISVVAVILFINAGCLSTGIVSPYDPVIDKGMTEFSEQLNAFVKDMAGVAGKEEGTYDANVKTYNALSSKLDVFIERASRASEGKGCRLENKIYERMGKLLQNDIPDQLKGAPQAENGNSDGCNEILLVLVKNQLDLIQQIHRDADKCETSAGATVSCLRPATAATALKIANQSINAVSVVETAKKM